MKDGANIQDNCVMHGFPGQDTVVEEEGHIGHGAILRLHHRAQRAGGHERGDY